MVRSLHFASFASLDPVGAKMGDVRRLEPDALRHDFWIQIQVSPNPAGCCVQCTTLY